MIHGQQNVKLIPRFISLKICSLERCLSILHDTKAWIKEADRMMEDGKALICRCEQ
jgi:hypothetical protein